METTTYIIIALVVLSFCQYTIPEKTNKFISPVYDPIKKFIDDKNPLSKDDGTVEEDSICSDAIDFVCAGGITFDNSCKAALEGYAKVTPGEC